MASVYIGHFRLYTRLFCGGLRTQQVRRSIRIVKQVLSAASSDCFSSFIIKDEIAAVPLFSYFTDCPISKSLCEFTIWLADK